MATVNKPANREQAQTGNRPEVSATLAELAPKKRGPKPKEGGSKQAGKSAYPGIAGGKKLSEVPQDWNPETHKRLKLDNFTSESVFNAYTEKFPREPRKVYPGLLDAEGKPTVQLESFPADIRANVDFSFERKLEDGSYESIVNLHPRRNFKDRRTLAKALVPVLKDEIARLEKIASMTDDELRKHNAKETLQKAIQTKQKSQGLTDQDTLSALLDMLPPEMRAKLGQ